MNLHSKKQKQQQDKYFSKVYWIVLRVLFICNTFQSLSLGSPAKKSLVWILDNNIDHHIISFNLICQWQIFNLYYFRVATISIVILIQCEARRAKTKLFVPLGLKMAAV